VGGRSPEIEKNTLTTGGKTRCSILCRREGLTGVFGRGEKKKTQQHQLRGREGRNNPFYALLKRNRRNPLGEKNYLTGGIHRGESKRDQFNSKAGRGENRRKKGPLTA